MPKEILEVSREISHPVCLNINRIEYPFEMRSQNNKR